MEQNEKTSFPRLPEIVTTLGILGILMFSYEIQRIPFNARVFLLGGFGTLWVYLWDHYLDRRGRSETRKRDLALTALAAAVFVRLVMEVETFAALLISLPVFIGLVYHPRVLALKKIPYFKSFLVTTCIAVPATFLPLGQWPEFEALRDLFPLFCFIWTLVFTNAVLFDCLDVAKDRSAGIRTIAHGLGVRRTRIALVLLNVLMIVLWRIFSSSFPGGRNLIIFLLPMAAEMLALAFIERPGDRRVWTFLLDGTLVLPALLALIF